MNRMLVGLAVLAAAVAASPVAAVKPTKVDGDLFTVVMPGEPDMSSNVVAIPSGQVRIRSWTVADDGALYGITATDYPDKYVAAGSPEKFLEEERLGMANQLKGRLVSERSIKVQGNSGSDFSITSDNGDATARAVMVGDRVYTLLVLAPSSAGGTAADKFLTSLRLKPVAPATRNRQTKLRSK